MYHFKRRSAAPGINQIQERLILTTRFCGVGGNLADCMTHVHAAVTPALTGPLFQRLLAAPRSPVAQRKPMRAAASATTAAAAVAAALRTIAIVGGALVPCIQLASIRIVGGCSSRSWRVTLDGEYGRVNRCDSVIVYAHRRRRSD